MLESLIVAIFLANSSAFYSLQKITSLIPTSLCATKISINMNTQQIEIAERLINLLNEKNQLDIDQLTYYFNRDPFPPIESTRKWIELKDIIRHLEEKKAVYWLEGNHVLKPNTNGKLIVQYEKLNTKLRDIIESDKDQFVFSHTDESTKRFLKDNLISIFSDYTSDKSIYSVDKFKIADFLSTGGYPSKPLNQTVDNSLHINVGRDLSGNVIQSSSSASPRISQSIASESKNNKIIKDILIGLIVTIAGGLILYYLTK